ncbi:hypothetical protein XBP1_2510006 [Xenorhabdus bovienii str. puntauvense]|uniref:DUF4942 domain-containing protein n=1 Tax=Xenorhabdus bovienii str. puntauvense TaxID=1398201 RepID=A0A077NED4_XENBV|nr:hypothetical protein XBP1_2510006 [Xenorhabdus bovienii str. puntauvense]
MDVFERGLINVFKGLSWDYKTNSPCSFGKKIIINNLVTHNRWGFSLNWGWRQDQLADLERMLFLLDGKPIPDNRGDISTRLMEHIRITLRRRFTKMIFSAFVTFKRKSYI